MAVIFVTGIGTGVGKTLAAAVVAEALGAGYWKPVQTGDESDAAYVGARLTHPRIHPEVYRLALPASPHIAARNEGVSIDLERIAAALPPGDVVVEGAGGLMVPLNGNDFMGDLAMRLGAKVVLVSRNYLGSINHSLLTARVARTAGLDVAGWIFNDRFGDYEEDIARWSGYSILGRMPFTANPDAAFVRRLADEVRPGLLGALGR
ncbi:dethiobiotin synthase [Dinghuibacter silviterrae]|uniref:ATP-dependent dethiobiotin synthetase BioD n=1 Tax=Dinghuibacter silviterrae TaxID=1539049 RepID=A0A4V3GKZ6_9BACT|nr:dethiobiotin synthase [Dinghuibacter silviterrae]TDW97572.1 dethiobiotin synthetase [Dinghuibacter silviterrae]